jgi:hypothetical protein
MKRFGLATIPLLLFYWTPAQKMNLKDLINLLNTNQNKIETQLQKKGFNRDFSTGNDHISYFQTRFNKKDTQPISRAIEIARTESGEELVYQTSSFMEDSIFKKDILSAGFHCTAVNPDPQAPLYFQKQNVVLKCFTEKVDSTVYYRVSACKKNIPKTKDIVYAEDLLQLDAHEYLAAAFGKQNVRQDSIYFTKTISKKCTVIFPNTSRQAIFIWNDQYNLREIAFIIIGEQLSTEEQVANPVMLSDWRSKQGIYCGMSLREIQNINKQPISFYNWRTASAGLLAPSNKGELNFECLKPVFNCMNCGFLYVDEKKDIIQSSYAIDENQKVYVASFVVLPEKKPTNEEESSKK